MKYQTCIVAFLWMLCIVATLCDKLEHNGTEIKTAICNGTENKNCFQNVRTKGQKWVTTNKVMKDAVSYVTRKILRALNPEDITNISPKCFSHILKISTGLRQMKLWAFQFIDNMGKIPDGISNGGITALGDFDGCLDINVTGLFQGKSCMVELIPPLPEVDSVNGVVERVPELETAFDPDTIIGSLDSLLKPNYDLFVLRMSACVPSSCTEKDVQFIAGKALELTNIEWDVRVSTCQMKEGIRFEEWDEYTSLCIMGFLITLVISATLTDAITTYTSGNKDHRKNSGILFRILMYSSMYWNTERLLQKSESKDSIQIFNGLKTVSILWIMLCHTYIFPPVVLHHHSFVRTDDIKDFAFQVIINGFPSVDTFFFISGVLLMFGWMNSRHEKISFSLYFFHRYWRLTPPMMLIAAVQALVYRFGSGPMWHDVFRPFVENCRERWWMNLLYFNNFYEMEEACIGWTWYLACEMQLYLSVFLIILIIKKRPKIALSALAVMSVISLALMIANQFYYNLPAVLTYIAGMSYRDIRNFVKYGYFRAYVHAIVYFTGVAVGYVLFYRSKIQISPKMNKFCWFICLVSGLTVVYSGYIFQHIENVPVAVAAMHNVGSKVIWSLALGWVTIACCTGNGGFITKFLSWSAFTPLARLTFVTYLVHPIIMFVYYASSRVLIQTDHRTMAFLYLSFVLASFIVAYFLSMLIEAPFIGLWKVMFGRSPSTSQSVNELTNVAQNQIKKEGMENGTFKLQVDD